MAAPTITILSATQRTDGSFLVDVDFEVADADLDNLTINLAEFKQGTGAFAAALPQLSDRKHDAVSPLTGITAVPKTFRFVWNAFLDLSEGDFDDVSFKIEVTDGVTPVSDTLASIEVNTIAPETQDQITNKRLTRRRQADRTLLSFLGFGLLAPFTRGSNDFKAAGGIELIQSAVRQVLFTRGESPVSTGEIPWRPDFGTPLDFLRFQPNDEVLREIAFLFMARSIDLHEPRVRLVDVEIEQVDTTFTMRMVFDTITENVPENEVLIEDKTFVIEVGL